MMSISRFIMVNDSRYMYDTFFTLTEDSVIDNPMTAKHVEQLGFGGAT